MLEKDELMKEYVLENILEKYEYDATMEEVLEEVLKYKTRILEFEEPNPDDMLDVEENEKIAIDTKLLSKYNKGVENISAVGSIIVEASEPYENVIKFEYKGKEIVLGYTEEIEYEFRRVKSYYEITFLMNVSTKKRLHIQASQQLLKNPQYDKCFIDYEKKLDEYDAENDKKYGDYLSDRLEQWKNKKELNLEKYQLSDSEKEFLVNTFETYEIFYSLILKDGILCINSKYDGAKVYDKEHIEKICDFIDMILKILEKFMNIV